MTEVSETAANSRCATESVVTNALVPISRLVSLRQNAKAVVALSRQSVPNTEVPSGRLQDRLGRPLSDLRLSVTDRCNFRCVYCMPRAQFGAPATSNSSTDFLDVSQIEMILDAFVRLGVKKLRLTGGEPLVRRDLSEIIGRAARLSFEDICLTTNGSLLSRQAKSLVDVGLGRITVSLDALDDVTFERMSDSRTSVRTVLSGIDAARKAGIRTIKLNMVVKRGVNEHAILPMARFARQEGLTLRFIEFMDVGQTNGWQLEQVVPAPEILALLEQHWPLHPLPALHAGETAVRFAYSDNAGEIGLIASVTQPFCGNCSRARVTARGLLHGCLFAPAGLDLARIIRNGGEILPAIGAFWQRRDDRYSETRNGVSAAARPEMSQIGG